MSSAITPSTTVRVPLWRRILSVDQYSSSIDRSRANLIYAMTIFIVIGYTFYATLVPQWTDAKLTLLEATLQAGFSNPISILYVALYILSFLTLVVTRMGMLELAAWGVPAVWYVSGLLLNIYVQDQLGEVGMALAQFIVIAGLTKREQGVYISGGVAAFTLIAGYFVRGQRDSIEMVIYMLINIIATATVLWAFLRYFSSTMSTSISEAINERIQVDKVVAATTHLLESRPPTAQFLHDVSKHIREQFSAIERVQVFLLDPEVRNTYLAADSISTEAMTPVLVQDVQSDTLPMIGQVLRRGEATFARQGVETAELLLPLQLGTDVFGVIGLTGSAREFSSQNVRGALEGLAADLSVAVDNVLQFDRAEQRQQENRQLIEQANQALRSVEQMNQRLTRSMWSQYVEGLRESIALDVDFSQQDSAPNPEWTHTLKQALENANLVQEINENAQVIAVPLQIRGQVIGAMEFELDPDQNFTLEDMEMVQEVAERFGMTAENTRLLVDSQRHAQREVLVNQISLRLQSASNVNAALTEAARGIRDALRADRVTIRLGKPTAEAQGEQS